MSLKVPSGGAVAASSGGAASGGAAAAEAPKEEEKKEEEKVGSSGSSMQISPLTYLNLHRKSPTMIWASVSSTKRFHNVFTLHDIMVQIGIFAWRFDLASMVIQNIHIEILCVVIMYHTSSRLIQMINHSNPR